MDETVIRNSTTKPPKALPFKAKVRVIFSAVRAKVGLIKTALLV